MNFQKLKEPHQIVRKRVIIVPTAKIERWVKFGKNTKQILFDFIVILNQVLVSNSLKFILIITTRVHN